MAPDSGVRPTKQQMRYRGLREWLDQVDKMGELLRVNGAHWDTEMGALTHMPKVVDVSAELRAKLTAKFSHVFGARQ